jgi:hypothetical protein
MPSEKSPAAGSPPEPTPLTPDALESLLCGLDHEAFVAFVADLRERCGRAVDREGSLLTVTRDDGDRERLLVRTDGRSRLARLRDADPETPDADAIDAVVTRDRDAGTAAAVAEDIGARVVDTAAIHDRLLYAIDRESARALCGAWFDRPVDLRPAPGTAEASADGASPGGVSAPGALLVGIALLGLIVAGAAGLPAGPLGDAPDPAATPGITATVASADDAGGATPGGESTPAGDDPGTPPPPDDGDPGPPVARDCPECPSLLTFEEAPTVTADATTTVTATLSNPYPFALSNVTVELEAPAGDWIVNPAEGTTARRLGPGESRSVAWTVAAPPDAGGNHTLTAVSVYGDGENVLRTAGEYELDVGAPGLRRPTLPPCTEALGPLVDGGSCYLLTLDEDQPELDAGTTTTLTGRLYNPRNDDLTDGSVRLKPPSENWTITPVNGTTFDRLAPDEVRRAAWNVTPPVTASGDYTIASNTTYTRPEGPGRENRSAPYGYHVSVSAAEVTRPPEVTPCHLDSGPINGSGPCYLLTFPDDPPEVAAGTTTTLTGRLYNPREYALANGSVRFDPPGNWTATPVAGTTFEQLEPGAVRVARWNLTAPASAGGTVALSGVTNYTRPGAPGEPNVSLTRRYPIAVSRSSPSAPCEDCESLLALDPVVARAGSTTTVTGTVENPTDVGVSNVAVELRPPGENWTVEPINGTAFQTLPEGASRPAAWNLTPPPDANGTYTVRASGRYDTGTGSLQVVTEHEVTVDANRTASSEAVETGHASAIAPRHRRASSVS